MAEKKTTWKKRLGAFVPRFVPNCILSSVMGFLGVLKGTSGKQVTENRNHNQKLLVEQGESPSTRKFFVPGTFIENQRHWKEVKFGGKYTMSYGGCEIFAVYNALLSLGEEMTGQNMVELISYFERRGAVWAGSLGIAPRAARKYFKKRKYEVTFSWSRKEETIQKLGEKSDTLIVTAYNDGRDIFQCIHTVNISKDGEGKFHVHNDFYSRKNARGEVEFVSHGPYGSLWEAVTHLSGGTGVPICITGISKRVENETEL